MSTHFWRRGTIGPRYVCAVALILVSACRVAVVRDRSPSRGGDDQRISALMQGSADAWNRGDLAGHLSIYADSVTFMTDTGPRTGIKPIEVAFARKYFRDGRPKQTLAFDQLLIRYPAADIALVTGRFRLTGGGEEEQSGRFTLIWKREAGRWAVIHDHSS